MDNTIKIFKEISKLPRPSGKEEKVKNYLVNFAKKNNLEYYTDKTHNVIIKKPSNRQNCTSTLILQGHTDMVCEALPEVEHDFLKDPIKFVRKDERLFADGTTLGADRVANAIAAAEFYQLPAAVIDCGTAVTMEVIDKKCRFAGGAIAPGRKLLRKALHTGTAQLPDVPLAEKMPVSIGRNTVDAITFGTDAGIVGTVRQWLTLLRRDYPDLTVILTGGDAGFLASEFPEAIVADEYFTLHGIRLAGGY